MLRYTPLHKTGRLLRCAAPLQAAAFKTKPTTSSLQFKRGSQRERERELYKKGRRPGRTVEDLVHRRRPPPHSHSIHGGRSSPLPAGGGGRRARRPLRRRVVRVPHGPAGQHAAEDAGLRVRRRRRLQAHPAERRLLRAGHRQGALLLRCQQLLPAQQPEPAGLRLLRHRRALQQRPQRQWLHVPCDPKRRCDNQQRRHVQPSHNGSVSPQRQQCCCQRHPGGWIHHAAADLGLLLARRSLPRRVIMETRRPSSPAVGGVLFLSFLPSGRQREPFDGTGGKPGEYKTPRASSNPFTFFC